MQAGQTLTFNVSATDFDGGTVTLQASNLPANSSFTPNPAIGTPTASGTFSFTPTAAQASQTFNLSFSASDDQGCSSTTSSAIQVVTISVPGVVAGGSLPCGNHAPVISVPSLPAVGVGQTCDFVVKATDQDGDQTTLFADYLPENAQFDPATGRFSFSPDVKQLRQAQLGQGVIVIFVARDNQGAESRAIVDITPIASGDGPMPPSISVPPGPIVLGMVDRLSFEVAGLAQSPGCSVSITGSSPVELAPFNQAINIFSFTPNASIMNKSFVVNFTATDCAGRTRSASVRIIVIDATSSCAPRGTGRLDVSNNRLDFEPTGVNDDSGAATFSVMNRGGGPLSINSVALSDDINYRVEGIPALPFTLQPGGTLELRVFFEPKSAGTMRGTLTIVSSDSEKPSVEIRLRGKGTN